MAVSGGGDSMALLLLAQAWAQAQGHDLHAVTIDHGLRPEAAAEAAFVAAVCARLGIDHTTIAWHGRKPDSGLPQAAREARYRLLERHAKAIGADVILAAHSADDQAETVAMRLARGGGSGRGTAGMARRTLLPDGTVLARPLLATSRAELRHYLASVGQGWIEDPTNRDEAYERVRVRRALAAAPQRREALLQLALAAGRWRAVVARDAAGLLDRCVTRLPGLVLELDFVAASRAPEPVLVAALQSLIAAAGGSRHFVSPASLAPILSGVGRRSATTLGGALIECGPKRLRFWRERRNLARAAIAAGESLLWDGRLEIANRSQQPIRIGPPDIGTLDRIAAARRQRGLTAPHRALASAPVIADAASRYFAFEGCYEQAGLLVAGQPPAGIALRRVVPAIEFFCPQSDEPLFNWARQLGGRQDFRPAREAGRSGEP